MSIKDRIRQMKSGSQTASLIGTLVDRYLIERPPDDRDDSWHVSDICMMCARARALRIKHMAGGIGNNPTSERIFDMGKGIHHIYQNWYLGPAGVLWGKWKCLRCDREEWGFRPKSLDGEGCFHDGKSHSWKYQEVPVRVTAADRLAGYPWAEEGLKEGKFKDITGHADGLVLCGNPSMWVVPDFKSCKEEIFRFTYSKAPHEAHRRQVNMYGYFIGRGFVEAPDDVEIPEPERSLVMYVNKSTSEEKEHIDRISEDLVKESLDEVAKFDRFSVTGELPDPHPVCDSRDSKRAKKCTEFTSCFSLR